MPYPTPPNPGTVVPSGSLITPSGTMGAQGPTGPTGVSVNAGNLAQLGTDNLVLVPQNTVQGLSKYYGSDTGTSTALVVSVNSDFQLVRGVVVWVVPANICGASPTLNVNGTGATPIVNRASIAISASEIVQGKMIGVVYDGSSWRTITPVARRYNATNPGSVNLECAGYDSVSTYIIFTVSGGTGLTLLHVGEGVPITVVFANSYSSPNPFWVKATLPNGAATSSNLWIGQNALTGAASVDIGTGASITNGYCFQATGVVLAGALFLR